MKLKEKHLRMVLGASLCALVAACGGGGGGSSHDPVQNPPFDENSPAVLPVNANDLVWDPVTQRIYLSVSASTGPDGNVVMAVNPVTGAIVASQFAGSEPNRLSVSDDGAYLYVGVDGSSSVKRFVLPSLTPDYTFSLGMSEGRGPNIALDLAAAPGAAHTLAVSIGITSGSPMADGGIAIYDDVTPRPTIAKEWSSIYYSIQWGDDASELFAYNGETTGFNLYQISVDDSGAHEIADYPGMLGGFYNKIHYDRGNRLIYADNGRVADPHAGEYLGEFVDAFGLVAPDSAGSAVYFADGATTEGDMSVRIFDPQTYELKNILALKNVYGQRSRFIRWGDAGLAFATEGGPVYVTNSNGSRSATLPSLPNVSAAVVTVPIEARDIVWDSGRNRIYASVPASATSNANSIASVNVSTGATTFFSVGGDPAQLALSDDRQYLYVGLDGTSTIARYSLPNFASDTAIALPPEGSDPTIALDIQVLPDMPRSIAVAVGGHAAGYDRSAQPGVVIFDDATARPVTAPSTTYDGILHIHGFYDALQFGATGSDLFAVNSENSGFELFRLSVTAEGVSQVAKYPNIISGYQSGIHFDKGAGVIYFDDGHTADPETAMPVGRFPYAFAMTPDSSSGKAFLVLRGGDLDTDYAIVSYDLQRFTPIAWTQLRNVSREPFKIIRFGSDGLAMQTASSIYLVRSSVVQ